MKIQDYGYNDKGMVYRWHTPNEWHGVLMINLMDFLDSSVSIYMNIHQPRHGYHILAFTYSSSDLRWMHKASFEPVNEGGHYMVAQWLRWIIISNEAFIYSQHIKGS